MRQVEPLPSAGDADVRKPTFLLQFLGLAQRADVREHAVFESDDEDHRELQALRRVQRHEHDLAVIVSDLFRIGDQRHGLEEVLDRLEVLRLANELSQVLEPTRRLDRVLGLQVGDVARLVEHGLQHLARAAPDES